jgi:hypothetical protein
MMIKPVCATTAVFSLLLSSLLPSEGFCQQPTKDEMMVVAQTWIPYWTAIQQIGTAAPGAGSFTAGKRFCIQNKVWNIDGKPPIMEIDLGNGQTAYAVFDTTKVSRFPKLDEACNGVGAARLAAEMATPPMPARPSQPVNNDPQTQAEIADVIAFFQAWRSTHQYDTSPLIPQMYQRIVSDPTASQAQTKMDIAQVFRIRGESIKGEMGKYEANYDWLTDDKKFGYLVTARRWYKMALDQIEWEHPDIKPGGHPTSDDPDGKLHAQADWANNGYLTTPNEQTRQDTRVRLAQERHAEDPNDLHTPPRIANRQVCLSDCSAQKSRCDTREGDQLLCSQIHSDCLKQCPGS